MTDPLSDWRILTGYAVVAGMLGALATLKAFDRANRWLKGEAA